MANLRLPLLLLALACHSSATINDVQTTALKQIGKALGYNNSAFYSDPCNDSHVQCDSTNTSVVVLSFKFASEVGGGTISEAIGSLTHLRTLTLAGLNLEGQIPESIANLTLLTYLEFSTNKLSGFLPQGLSKLTLLTVLDLHNNLLTGSLPESIANLTQLTYLDFSTNKLSGSLPHGLSKLTLLNVLGLNDNLLTGSLPESIANLTSLISLDLSENLLSGSIPQGLGSLTFLTGLRLNDNLFTGSLPSSLGRLTMLVELDIYHNQLNGTIPPQLGYCTSLTTLHLAGNGFSGETSFLQNLVSLKYLYLGYNQFSGTIFNTLLSLTNLSSASLRKNNFNDSLPFISSINLQYLDLAFNQITGTIPQNFGGTSLQYLFLDHNNLTGAVPESSFSSMSALQMLDLSHNSLQGSTKFKTQLGNIQTNFAFHYLDDDSFISCNSSSSTLLDHCSPSVGGNLHSFAINAGGYEIAFDNILYQSDLEQRFGFHYATDGSRTWAVENSKNPKIVTNYSLTVAEIYKSMHSTQTYLGYHGTQLQPGTYNVTLHFAELEGDHSGFRVFDVYVQGRLLRKDLDVFALVRNYVPYVIYNQTEVTSGVLSVQLIYSSKSTGSFDQNYGRGPMISALSATLISTPINNSGASGTGASKFRQKNIIIGSTFAVFTILAVVAGLLVFWLRKKNMGDEDGQKIGLVEYQYATLCKATNNFSESNKIGEGGFGSVYKGLLPNGSTVAIKKLHGDKTARHEEEFKKEIQLISMVRHQNLLVIIGYCSYFHRSCSYFHKSVQRFLLVSHCMPNGSLEKQLFPENENFVLSWELRYKIALGIASGLAYLHDESQLHMIHCDVKPHNILLDEDFNPFLTDFGLARLFDDGKSHVTISKLQGTIGYLAPEYATKYQLSDKIDVYSFGVVLLQLLSGKHVLDLSEEMVYIVDWAHGLGVSNMEALMDKRLGHNYSGIEAMRSACVAILCTSAEASKRPRMHDVRLMLEGTIDAQNLQLNL